MNAPLLPEVLSRFDRRPRCDRAVDPFGELPCFCRACKTYLAQPPPRDWLDDFEQELEPVPRQSFVEEGASAELRTLFIPARADIKAPDGAGSYRYLAWRQHFLFEDACAIWDTLGNAHRDCAHGEPQAGLNQYSAVEFTCPVAAASLRALAKIRLLPEGAFLDDSVPTESDLLKAIQRAEKRCPQSVSGKLTT